jgi:hypothetical protein
MEPFLEEETQTKTTNKVTFKINTNGEIEFDATGLEEWETAEVIQKVTAQAQNQHKAAQTKQLTSLTSEFAMHGLAIAFSIFLVSGLSFTVSRIISGLVTTPPSTQLSQ